MLIKIFQIQKPISMSSLKKAMNRVFVPDAMMDELEYVSVDNAHHYINTKSHILIVEDNPVNQVVIKSYLERLGLKQIDIILL